jgi:tRNA/tmRNA/rRNA uracil-C5-methylase (TrmA/RlmC/RlmD family)
LSGVAQGEVVELAIERLAAGGDGIAHVDGLTVFVPLSAPGDRVRARVVAVQPRFARAEIEAVLAPGPGRRAAPCPYYGHCGGCTWMHLDEAEQARGRDAIVREALQRIGGVAALPELEHVASPAAFAYRSRARIAWERRRVGFRARASREVVDVERCLVLDPATETEFAHLRGKPPPGHGEREIRGYGEAVVVAGKRLAVGPSAFFQANRPLWPRWQELVVDACGRGERAVELYCGVGFYTVGLCERFARVVAVERSPAARDARRNCPAAHVVEESAEAFAARELASLAPELVLLNPPRTGCHQAVSDALRAAMPRRVVYVSCDAPTLARDVARIGADFRIARVVVLDALPQTHHVEVVVVLESV